MMSKIGQSIKTESRLVVIPEARRVWNGWGMTASEKGVSLG